MQLLTRGDFCKLPWLIFLDGDISLLQSVIVHERLLLCSSTLLLYHGSLKAGLNVDVGKPQAIFSRAWLLPTQLTPDAG